MVSTIHLHLHLLLLSVVLTSAACSSASEPSGASPETSHPAQRAVPLRADCDQLFGAGARWSGGENAFGECAGACSYVLAFGDEPGCRQLRLNIADLRSRALTMPNTFATNFGELTDKGVEAGRRVSESWRGKAFAGIYGCPDCADGGSSELRSQEGAIESAYYYPFRGAPPDLKMGDDLLQALIDSLTTCTDHELVTVTPGVCTPQR